MQLQQKQEEESSGGRAPHGGLQLPSRGLHSPLRAGGGEGGSGGLQGGDAGFDYYLVWGERDDAASSCLPTLQVQINAYKLSLNLSAIEGIRQKAEFLVRDSGKADTDPTKKFSGCKLLRDDFGETFSVVRLDDGSVLTLYRSFHANLAGSKHVTSSVLKCADVFQIENIVPLVRSIRVDNIHASGKIRPLCDLLDLCSLADFLANETHYVKHVRFMPQVFPALVVKTHCVGTAQIFSTGSVIILGTRTGRQLSACRRWINSVIRRCLSEGRLHYTGPDA